MKQYTTLLLLLISITFSAQNYNTKNGFVAEGYDVVSYFNNKAEKGNKEFTTEFDGVKFKFSSKENLAKFKENPKKYAPQYGGYCAYAIGLKGEKVTINPKTYEIRDGKLYLFYNSWGTNTLELWQKEGPEKLQKQADKNWKKIIAN
ncbi:YHS domain-containing protein [Polaribacter sp. KT25b]|uniref:YHS domain-containing (seleno)protein n=1 Tax=Polaribacter sp. KT25b TaxID=1855336 RepID=UPI0008796346|nr:YHS domain-containing (seleno)protein [Polaribacter sp. KT25b]SDS50616.1 YHS domain-containing protein [Polaribacter sp. KT25b]